MTKKIQLKNGLKVLLIESHKSPVVSVQMWVRTGSADERKGEEGISHFIEHLVFKGTRKFKVGEIASSVEGSGGELNAYTSFDQTVFYVTISKEFSDQGLEVISEMMGHALFDAGEIDSEREVVIEEIKMGQDSPQRQASQLLFSTAFKRHGYGRPVIGYDKVIRRVSPKNIKQYFSDRYSPKNMFLVVSGHFSSAEMKKRVENYFGDFVSTSVRKVSRTKEPKQTKPRVEVKSTEFKQTQMYISWKIPPVHHPDIPALDVLAFILGQGDSSRLVKKLRMESSLANSVGASSFTPKDEGLFTLYVSMDPGNFTETFPQIEKTVAEFIAEGPSFEEMQKSVNCFASEQVYSVETVDGIARKVGNMEFYMGDPDYFSKYLKQVIKLKPQDIVRVAKKYLTPEKMNVSVLTDIEKKKAQETIKKFIKSYAKSFQPIKTYKSQKAFKAQNLRLSVGRPKASAETEKMVLPSGVKILLREQKDSPIFSCRVAFLGGLRKEPFGHEGLTEMISRTWTTGSEKFNEEEINHQIDTLAAGFGAFGGRNTLGINLDGLSSFQKDLSEIFFDTLLNPTWSESSFDREKTILLNQIKTKNDNPSQVCISQFMKGIFPQHVYGRDVSGTGESVTGLTNQEIKSFHKGLMKAGSTTFCLVGDFDRDYWVQKIRDHSEGLTKGRTVLESLPLPAISQPVKLYTHLAKEQSHIVMGFRGLTLTSEDRYTLQVVQSILAGQGGRLFIELRDKNSLAYSVAPLKMEGTDTGYFGAYIGCSPDKGEKAIQMMQDEFKKLCDTRVGQAELERSHRYLVGRHDIDLQRKSALCSAFLFNEVYGIDYSEVFESNKKIFSVTAEDIRDLSQRIFNQAPVISVVGPQDVSL